MEAFSSSTAASSRPGLGLGILGLDLGDDDARLVHDGVTQRDAFRQRLATHHVPDGAAELGAGVDACNRSRHQMLGQHHGGRLQHLHVLVGVFLLRLVLHRQHAQHLAAAQHRHREERVVDLLARLGAIGEGWMVLRVRLVDGHRQLGAAPDQTLAPLQQRVVDGAGIEAFSGKQLERAVLALEVDGGHLGDHQTGDLAHDLVEPRLPVGRLGHDLPQPAHDDAQRRLGRNDPGLAANLLHHPISAISALRLEPDQAGPLYGSVSRWRPVHNAGQPRPASKALQSVFAQLVQAVQGSHGQLGVGRIDQHANFYLRRGDGENVDASLAQAP